MRYKLLLLFLVPLLLFVVHANTANIKSPSGQLPPTTIPGWNRIFVDDFNYNVPLGKFPSAVKARWGHSYANGWKDTSKYGTYMPSQVVSISHGVMNLYLHTNSRGQHLVAAPVPSIPALTSGIYLIRFKADPIPGYKTSWLLWPDSGKWPRDGEINFPEGDLYSKIFGFVHHQNGIGPKDQIGFRANATYTKWHTAEIIWIGGQSVTFKLDGRTIGSTTYRVPNTPMDWVLQTETWLNKPPPNSAVSGNVKIDWVEVFTR